MPKSASPADQRRVDTLREHAIMDTTPERGFDDISPLTSVICETPIATVALLDLERQWFTSQVGLDNTGAPIQHSFCAHAIEQKNVFIESQNGDARERLHKAKHRARHCR